MANIPIADKHDETAVNQHLVPQCYMREWCYNSKKHQYGVIVKNSFLTRVVTLLKK